jgi:hypothetical protein
VVNHAASRADGARRNARAASEGVVSRRALLQGACIATVLVAGGTVWRAWHQGVFSTGRGPAYEPWRTWRSDGSEGPLGLVRAAILAANPYNSQPWLFRVSGSSIDVLADPGRNIGAIDPFRREMYAGVGCALENLVLAAEAGGYRPEVRLLPDPANPAHAAGVALAPGKASLGDLYGAIPRRHTNRGPYDPSRPVAVEVLRELEDLAGEGTRVFWFAAGADRKRVGDLIVSATEAIVADREQSEASARWLRFRWADVQRHRDGVTVDTSVRPASMRVAAKMLPPLSREQGDRFWLTATRESIVPTAAGFGILAVRDADDNADRLRGGRAWQRLHLRATTHGLAMQPLSQLTERADRERSAGTEPSFGRALRSLTGTLDWQALMVFRFGYPTEEALMSPRRPVEWVLV